MPVSISVAECSESLQPLDRVAIRHEAWLASCTACARCQPNAGLPDVAGVLWVHRAAFFTAKRLRELWSVGKSAKNAEVWR